MKYLHELLITVGLGLVVYGFNQPWSAYDEAEIKRIEFQSHAERLAYEYSKYAERVNEQIAIHRSCVEEGEKCDLQDAKKKMKALGPDIAELGKASDETMLENKKIMQLTMHFQKMKNIWLTIGIASCLLGVTVLGVGLRGVLSSSRPS